MEIDKTIDPSMSGCFTDCYKLKRGEGRGWCKLGCWGDWVLTVIRTLVDWLGGDSPIKQLDYDLIENVDASILGEIDG